jgi:hypothetical protein
VFIDLGTEFDAHAPYCHLWRAWLNNIFSHYSINSITSENKKDIKLHFDFLYKFVWNISNSKKNSAMYIQKCILVFMYSTVPVILVRFQWNFNFLYRISKILKYHTMKIRSVGAVLFHADGQTGGERRQQALLAILWTSLKNGASKYNIHIPWVDRGSTVVKVLTELQIRRLLVRSQMVSWNFSLA